MVSLSEINSKKWYVDTRDARLTMYKAMNWIPPYLLDVPRRLKLPEVLEKDGIKYKLVDGDFYQRHYEVDNGNTK